MGNDYDSDKANNYEKDVSMIIELNKTCYFKGEEIKGNIILSSKNGLKGTLVNPYEKKMVNTHMSRILMNLMWIHLILKK